MANPTPAYRDYKKLLDIVGVKRMQASNCTGVCECIVRPYYMDEIERENARERKWKKYCSARSAASK